MKVRKDKTAGYRELILKHLYFSTSLSCADISQVTGKSIPLVTETINHLVAERLVIENGFAPSTGGRPPLLYTLKPDSKYVIGISVDQLTIRIAALDMHHKYATEIKQLPFHFDKPDALSHLTKAIKNFIGTVGIAKKKLAGIGIGMPGFVDHQKGTNYSFPTADYETNIVDTISAATNLPVFIDNDSRVIALSELKWGAAKGKKEVMVINIGWGIGLGIVQKGELFRGYSGLAGEFSHIPLFTNNKLCSCGKTGCLQTETSLLAIADKAIEGLQQGKVSKLKDLSKEKVEERIDSIFTAAANGDRFAIDLLSESAYHIGRGISVLIHLFNPELIILSGRGAQAGKLLLAPIQQAINENCIPRLAENTQVLASSQSASAAVTGAAALVMDNIKISFD
jgi:glucokinase-like ROK family protein